MIWTDGGLWECLNFTSYGPDGEPNAWRARDAPAAGGRAALEPMTVAQLKAYAQERGISLSGKTIKADIIAAIKAAI